MWAWVFPRDDQHLTSLRAPGLGSFTGCSLEAGEDLTGHGRGRSGSARRPPHRHTPEETRGLRLALLQGGAGPADGLLLEAVQDKFTQ